MSSFSGSSKVLVKDISGGQYDVTFSYGVSVNITLVTPVVIQPPPSSSVDILAANLSGGAPFLEIKPVLTMALLKVLSVAADFKLEAPSVVINPTVSKT